MNRSITLVLGGLAALALTSTGLTTATATQQPQPEPGDWVTVDETFTLPAGSACRHEVTVKEKAKYRDILYKDENGEVVKIFSEFKNWSTVKFSATTKHHGKKVTRRIKLNEGGDAWIYNRGGDFDTLLVEAEGKNWGQGAGVYGIPWSNGDISYTVTDANDPIRSRIGDLDLSHARKFFQVCYKIGSKPVDGKNVPPAG